MELLVKKLRPLVETPSKAKENDAGFDLYADLGGLDTYWLEPGEVKLLDTGIAAMVPAGYCAILKDRSGNAAKNNTHIIAGVIDSGYSGEWKVLVANLGKQKVRINRNDRIAQFLIVPVPDVTIKEVDELPGSERGAAGFGSTGT